MRTTVKATKDRINARQHSKNDELVAREATCSLQSIEQALDAIEQAHFDIALLCGHPILRQDFPSSVERIVAAKPNGASIQSSLGMVAPCHFAPSPGLSGLLKAFVA